MGSFECFKTKPALGGRWLLIDWDAIRLPAGITVPR
jgi:hypothetical protein